LMLILLYATYSNMRQLRTSSDDLRRFDNALLELAAMRAGLQDHEIAVKGYLHMGDTLALAALDIAGLRASLHTTRMDSLLPEPSWKAQLHALYRAGDRMRAHLIAALEARQRNGEEAQLVN